ncbi:6-pyruvoyl-tetrahydropterin synthase-related protein [Chloroflexota bacterium]
MKLKLSPNVRLLLALLIIEFLVLFLISPLLQDGLPQGIDTPFHLFSSWFLTKSLEAGTIPDINPYWYGGQPFLKYYPPLAYYSIHFLTQILGDVTLSYKILTVFFFLLTPLTIYILSREFGLDKKSSLLSTFLFTSSYAYISNISIWGRFTTHLALPFFVLTLYFLLRLQRGGIYNAIYGGICLGVLLLLHQLTAYAFLIILAIYLLAEVVKFFTKRDLKPFKNLAIMTGVGVLISSWWLVPFLMRINDIGFQRTIPGGFSFPMSFFWDQIFNLASINTRVYPFYIGYTTVFLASLGAVHLLVKRRPLIVLFAAFIFLISLGTNLKSFYYLPYYNNLDVARFFLYGVILLSILCGFGFAKILQFTRNKILVFIMVALILLPSVNVALQSRYAIKTWQIDESQTQALQWLRDKGEPGRAYGIGLDCWDSYLLPVYTDRSIIDGWSHESAKNWRDIILLDNMESGSELADMEAYYRILKEYDAKYVLLGDHLGNHYFPKLHFMKYEEYVKLLQADRHFKEVTSFGDNIIFQVVLDE